MRTTTSESRLIRIAIGLTTATVLWIGAVLYWANRPAPPSDRVKAPSREPRPVVQVDSVRLPAEAYTVVGRRNLFGEVASTVVAPETEASTTPITTAAPARVAEASAAAASSPATDQISVVGTVTMEGTRQAAIEDVRRGETKFLRLGESAFGYRLTALEDSGATLERDGKTYRVAFGDNKPDRTRGRSAGGGGTGGSAASVAFAEFPTRVQEIASRLLPADGELTRARLTTLNGQEVYSLQKTVNGLDSELWLTPSGQVARREVELRSNDLPTNVASVANSALEGYSVDANNKPSWHQRDGQQYYEVRVVPQGGGRGVDLFIAPDGRIVRQN